MDTSDLGQTLTCAQAIDWLKAELEDFDDEGSEPDDAVSTILQKGWESDEELLGFFKEISIQLASTATQDNEDSSASLFDRDLPYNLSLDSPYYELWEKAWKTNSPLLKEKIRTEGWNSCLDTGIEWLHAIALIPIAMAYEKPLFEMLRNRAIITLSAGQEEFFLYIVAMLSSGYFEGEIPVEIINTPSSEVLIALFYSWKSHSSLWIPTVIAELLESEYANRELKDIISNHLKNVDVDDEEDWLEHLNYYWSSNDIERTLELCE